MFNTTEEESKTKIKSIFEKQELKLSDTGLIDPIELLGNSFYGI
jgi:hypothetical protein